MAQNKQGKIDILTLILALISWHMVLAFRYSSNWGMGWFAIVQPLFSIVLTVLLYLMARRCQTLPQTTKLVGAWLLISLIGVLGLGILGRRQGIGDSWEMLTLMSLGNLSLGLAVLSKFTRWRNWSVLFSSICCFLVLPIADDPTINLLASVFGFTLLMWLITEYWRKVDQKLATQQTQRQWSPKAITILASVGMMALIGSATIFFAPIQQLDLPGFSWFSGGKDWSDEFANAGVGDGNKVRAATEMANSLGPVDSDIFMESKRESLFDVASEAYGKPRKANKNKAIALDAEMMQHNHSRIARSQKASAEFSTKRKTQSTQSSEQPKDQLVDALFFLKGRIPLRLALETYNTFEEGVWKQVEPTTAEPNGKAIDQPGNGPQKDRRHLMGARKSSADGRFKPVLPITKNGYPWMSMRKHPDTLYAGLEYASVKVTNLKSLRIPAPPCMERFYIDQVDRAAFFGVGTDDIAQLTNGSVSIPDMTVLHILSSGINLYDAQIDPQKIKARQRSQQNKNQPYLNDEVVDPMLAEVAQQWTKDSKHDWAKVSAIVQKLRNEFTHDRKATLPENESDVTRYLLEGKVGSDYMFATTAALMFRSLGIPSRVTTGFMATAQGYDHSSGHTAVTSDDIHVWAEVSLDGDFWIPVEPTPGYPEPRYQLTLMQRCTLAILSVWDWIMRNPILTISMLLVSLLLIWNFRWLANALQTTRWRLVRFFAPSRLVLETSRLIDKRAALAGLPRPVNRSPSNFSQWLAHTLEIPETEAPALQRFTRKLDRLLYHPKPMPASKDSSAEQVLADCQCVIQNLPYHRMRQTRKSTARPGGSKSPC